MAIRLVQRDYSSLNSNDSGKKFLYKFMTDPVAIGLYIERWYGHLFITGQMTDESECHVSLCSEIYELVED